MSRFESFATGAHGHEYSYSFKPAPKDEEYPQEISSHIVQASHQGNIVGFLKWDTHLGEVTDLDVLPQHRRKGVATEMWNHAHIHASNKGLVPPQHSSTRTEPGTKWAQTVGGHIPPVSDEQGSFVIERSKKDFLNMADRHET